MKKYIAIAILGVLFLGSCAQKEENREKFKAEHNVTEKRNEGVPDAAISDSSQVEDSMEVNKK